MRKLVELLKIEYCLVSDVCREFIRNTFAKIVK